MDLTLASIWPRPVLLHHKVCNGRQGGCQGWTRQGTLRLRSELRRSRRILDDAPYIPCRAMPWSAWRGSNKEARTAGGPAFGLHAPAGRQPYSVWQLDFCGEQSMTCDVAFAAAQLSRHRSFHHGYAANRAGAGGVGIEAARLLYKPSLATAKPALDE